MESSTLDTSTSVTGTDPPAVAREATMTEKMRLLFKDSIEKVQQQERMLSRRAFEGGHAAGLRTGISQTLAGINAVDALRRDSLKTLAEIFDKTDPKGYRVLFTNLLHGTTAPPEELPSQAVFAPLTIQNKAEKAIMGTPTKLKTPEQVAQELCANSQELKEAISKNDLFTVEILPGRTIRAWTADLKDILTSRVDAKRKDFLGMAIGDPQRSSMTMPLPAADIRVANELGLVNALIRAE